MRTFMLFIPTLIAFYTPSLMAYDDIENEEEDSYWQEGYTSRPTVAFESDIGLHMSSVGFGSQIALYQYLTSYFQVGQSFRYFRNDDEKVGPTDLHYGMDINMRLAPFQEFMFSPFLSVGFGYNQWQVDGEKISSPRVNYDAGLNIQLSRFFTLLMVHKDINFTNEAPITYWGQKVSSKSFTSDEVMLTFSLDNTMF